MKRSKIIFIWLVITIIVGLTGCSVFENKALPTGAVVLSTDNEQNVIDIIIKTNEKYKNMQDFKAVKIIKIDQGSISKEEIMIKGNKYRIKREWIEEESRWLIKNEEVEVSDGTNVWIYKKIYPSIGAYLELGGFYNDISKFEEAEELIEEGIELYPDDWRVRQELGRSYRDQGRFEEAEELFEKAIELNPDDGRAYFELGVTYSCQGRFEEAEELIEKAIELNPDHRRAYFELGSIYHTQGRFEEAEELFELFEKAIELNPDDGRAYFELGVTYSCQGRFEEAEELIEKAIELNPDHRRAYFELGRIYSKQGRFEEAEELFEKAMIDEEYKKRSTFEVIQDTRYDEIQYIDDILDISSFNFNLEQDENYYILEGKKSKSTVLWSKIKAEINKEDHSIAKLEFYNEIDGMEKLTKTIIYENISFNNNLSDEEFILTEGAGVE